MKMLVTLLLRLFARRKPDRLASVYAAQVLKGLEIAVRRCREGIQSSPLMVTSHRSILCQHLRYRFIAVMEIGEKKKSVRLVANPRLTAGYALAKRVRRELRCRLVGTGVKVSLHPEKE